MFKETKKKVTPQNSLILNCMELNLFLLVRTIINNVNIKITKKKKKIKKIIIKKIKKKIFKFKF